MVLAVKTSPLLSDPAITQWNQSLHWMAYTGWYLDGLLWVSNPIESLSVFWLGMSRTCLLLNAGSLSSEHFL